MPARPQTVGQPAAAEASGQPSPACGWQQLHIDTNNRHALVNSHEEPPWQYRARQLLGLVRRRGALMEGESYTQTHSLTTKLALPTDIGASD